MTNSIFRNSMIMALLLSFSLSLSANETVMIEIQGDDLELHKTDLSHLATGESEIIYTESGKELTITRTENGMEVLVDGEKIETGPHLAKTECNFEVFIETDCENCETELHESLMLAQDNSGEGNCSMGSTKIEKSWVSADGTQRVYKRTSSHSDGDNSAAEGEVRVIMIQKEVTINSEEN